LSPASVCERGRIAESLRSKQYEVGNTTVRPSGDLKAPGYMLVNLGATYATRIAGHGVAFRAAIDNLTNRRYWEFQYADYIAPGGAAYAVAQCTTGFLIMR
jgi:outer membrane receptor protein involved in Fe transport